MIYYAQMKTLDRLLRRFRFVVRPPCDSRRILCRWCLLLLFLIVGGMAGATTLRNYFAGMGQVVRYLKDSGEMKFETWDFSPSEVDFSNTGIVYRVSFSPKHALPHWVEVVFPTNRGWRGWRNVGIRAELHVSNGESAVKRKSEDFHGRIYSQRGKAGLDEEHHVILGFEPTDLNWNYDERISVEVRLRRVSSDTAISWGRGARLILREAPPFY